MFSLLVEQVIYAAFNVPPNELLTGGFITLSIGPVITGTVDRYRQGRGNGPPAGGPPAQLPEEDAPRDVVPTGDKDSDDWNRHHGWIEMTA